MNRREVLRNAALLVGGSAVLSGTTISVLFDSCSAPVGNDKPHNFTREEQSVITELADVIIPSTSCPGAKAAGVGPFITTMLHDCYPNDVQSDYVKGLGDFTKSAKKQFGKNFDQLNPEEKIKAVSQLRDQALEAKKKEKKPGEKKPASFFELTRDLTIMGYFSSEIGATQATAYLPIPGRYNGCADMTPGQKLWSVN